MSAQPHLLDAAKSVGLRLVVQDGAVRFDGEDTPEAARLVPLLRDHKAELLEQLTEANNTGVNVGTPPDVAETLFGELEGLLHRSGSALRLSFKNAEPLQIVADDPNPAMRELSVGHVTQICRTWQVLSGGSMEPESTNFEFLDDDVGPFDDGGQIPPLVT